MNIGNLTVTKWWKWQFQPEFRSGVNKDGSRRFFHFFCFELSWPITAMNIETAKALESQDIKPYETFHFRGYPVRWVFVYLLWNLGNLLSPQNGVTNHA